MLDWVEQIEIGASLQLDVRVLVATRVRVEHPEHTMRLGVAGIQSDGSVQRGLGCGPVPVEPEVDACHRRV